MSHFSKAAALLVTLAALIAGQAAWAADPNQSVITVKMMHCAGCARKMVANIQTVPGVAKVETDVKAKTVVITARRERSRPQAALGGGRISG